MAHIQDTYARLIAESLQSYLRNERQKAFEQLESKKYADTLSGKSADSHDGSSLLRCCHALMNLFEGLLSGSATVMSQCIEEFWEAEKLANSSAQKEWIGNRLSRALSYLLGGMLQVFTHSYVKAGVNLTVSFKLIRDLEKDIVSYSGPDPQIIRSFGFMLLSLFNMLSVILPPSISTIGDYLGLGVSREKYYEYAQKCNDENGEFSMMSNLIFIYFVVNSKNFLFEKATSDELLKCRSLIDACLTKGPKAIVVHVMHASVCLGEGNIKRAVETLDSPAIFSLLEQPGWTTMGLATYFKLGNCHLCDLNFSAARAAFSRARKCLETSDHWPYIPYMRTMEGLCYLAASSAHDSSVRETALDIFSQSFIDRDLSKQPVVLPGDKWAARVAYEQSVLLTQSSEDELKEFLTSGAPIVNLLFAMLTCLYTFEKLDAKKAQPVINSLRKTQKSCAKFQTVLGEFYRLTGNFDESVSAFDDAIELIDKQIRSGTSEDPDSVLGFSLVYQGAALCSAGDFETAAEVLKDLDETIANTRYSKTTGAVLKAVFAAPKVANSGSQLKPGNLVNTRGSELELILNFRRNGLKTKIDRNSSK